MTKPKKPRPKTAKPRSAKPSAAKPRTRKPRVKKPTKTEEEFELWMFFMQDALQVFLSWLPDEVSRRLDYSVESLDVLEAWLLDRYPDIHATRAEPDPIIFEWAARYIGETFCKTLGGQWWVDPKGKVLHGLPHVGDFRAYAGSTCPVTLATASTDRRTGHFISDLWRYFTSWITGRGKRSPFLDDPQYRKHNKVTIEELDFQYWLNLMDRAQTELLAEMPEALRDRLDYSPGSLDVLEAWLLARYPDADAARADAEVLTMDGVARYIGETFRRNLGGAWWFDLEGWSHNALPQIRWPGAADTDADDDAAIMPAGDASRDLAPPMCPLALAREAVAARRGDALADAFAAKRAALR